MGVDYANEENNSLYSCSSQILKVKTCTCSLGKETCPSHSVTDRSSGDGYFRYNTDLKLSDVSLTSHSKTFATESSVTIIPKRVKPKNLLCDELKLSLSSLTSDEDVEEKQKEKEVAFQRWLAEKNRQRKEELKKQEQLEKYMLNEKEKKMAIERLNFTAWLKSKKERERIEQKLTQEQKENEDRKLLEAKESKQKLAQMKIKLWLKQKEEQQLLSKMHEQLNKIKTEEEKQKRMQESIAAYETWLKNSKNKPKPVPLNQGLDSLRTSVSVSFINPTPWVPNINLEKPTTK